MTATADWFQHFDACARCSLWSPCRVGAPLLAAYVDATAVKLAPIPEPPISYKEPIVMIDLEAHRRDCLRCKPLKLCDVGRRIVEQAGEAIHAAAPNWPRRIGLA